MRKLWLNIGIFSLCALAMQTARAQDPISVGVSIQHLWDSNYERTPEEDAERIAIAGAHLAIDKTFSSQRIIGRWSGRRYEHDERSDLDASLHNAQLALKSRWTSRFKSEVEWVRDSYPVDRLEFRDKDIVRRDEAKVQLGYGAGHKLAVKAGGRQVTQRHSNDLRDGLNFDEEEGFLELAYQTGIKSTLAARIRAGERTYPDGALQTIPEDLQLTPEDLEKIAGDLDFDYEQFELEGVWIASPKTSISATLAYFTRQGAVNDSSGMLATTEATWEVTPKVQLSGGYSFRQPAVGETSDSPADIHLIYFDADWKWTSKISVGTGARVVEHRYEGLSPGPPRNESLYNATPIRVTYDPTESISLRLTTGWTDRQSPLAYRDYTSAEATVGAFFRY